MPYPRQMTRHEIKQFAVYSDEQLESIFANIGKSPFHRVKTTGFVKLRFAKYGDRILDELKRRRIAAGTYYS